MENKYQRLIEAAMKIVQEFDQYGEVLQSNDDGMYTAETSIEQLRASLTLLRSNECSDLYAGDHLPHLTEEQHSKIKDRAVACLMVGREDTPSDLEDVKSKVNDYTAFQRIELLGLDNKELFTNLCQDLGFNPLTGTSE